MEHRHPKKGEKYNIKIEVIVFIINFGGNKTMKNRKKYESKKGISVSEVFIALFNCS